MSCRYYGKHWAGTDFGLIDSGGNQCAAITRAYAPCRMEVQGAAPDETTCGLAIAMMQGRGNPDLASGLFQRTGEKVRVRMMRSDWIDGRIEISSRNGQSLMVSTEKPLVAGRTFAVHPALGFVCMPTQIAPDRGHGRPPVWRDTVTGVFMEIEFTGENDLPPELQPRKIISRTPEENGERAELACGHTIISVVGPVGEGAPCPECINAFVQARRAR